MIERDYCLNPSQSSLIFLHSMPLTCSHLIATMLTRGRNRCIIYLLVDLKKKEKNHRPFEILKEILWRSFVLSVKSLWITRVNTIKAHLNYSVVVLDHIAAQPNGHFFKNKQDSRDYLHSRVHKLHSRFRLYSTEIKPFVRTSSCI